MPTTTTCATTSPTSPTEEGGSRSSRGTGSGTGSRGETKSEIHIGTFFSWHCFLKRGISPLKFVSFPIFNTSRKKLGGMYAGLKGISPPTHPEFPHEFRDKKREIFQDSLLFPFSYCTVFELVRVTKACRNDKDFFRMQKGEKTTENEKNERMVTFRFGVKSPILPMNENSHLSAKFTRGVWFSLKVWAVKRFCPRCQSRGEESLSLSC